MTAAGTKASADRCITSVPDRPGRRIGPIDDKLTQLLSLYSIVGFIVIFSIGWFGFAHFVPPRSPADSEEQLAQWFQQHQVGIQVGMVMAVFASALLLPWGGAMCGQLSRLEGEE